MDSYYSFAQRAMKEREFYQAEWALRRMLASSNNLDRVKLDLSLSLLGQGKYLDARDLLQDVLSKNPPPEVQKNIGSVMKKVDEELKPHRISGNLAMGVNYDTNGNSSPATGQVTIVNTSIPLDPTAREQEDFNLFTAATVNHTYRTDTGDRSKTIRWKTDLVGYLAKQDKLDRLDLTMMSARTGPEVTWLNSGVRAGLYVGYTMIGLDGNDYLRSPKGEFIVDVPMSGFTTATFATAVEDRKYINAPTVTIYDERSGTAWQQSFALRHVLTDTWAIDGSVFFRHEDAKMTYYENDQYGTSVGATHLFDPSLVFNTRLGYKYYDYKGADLLISTNQRADTEVTAGATLAKSITISGYETKPTAVIGYLYRNMDSNIQNYEYENHRFSTSLNVPF